MEIHTRRSGVEDYLGLVVTLEDGDFRRSERKQAPGVDRLFTAFVCRESPLGLLYVLPERKQMVLSLQYDNCSRVSRPAKVTLKLTSRLIHRIWRSKCVRFAANSYHGSWAHTLDVNQ